MTELFLTMLERIGIIVMIAFVLTRLPFFRQMIYQDKFGRKQQFAAILFFGFFGIIGTYTGVSLDINTQEFDRWTGALGLSNDEAIANTRVIGVVIAGLLGGYKVGIGAGLIAGIHRFTLGGYTALACGLAAIIAGILSGAFHRKDSRNKISNAFFIGAAAETIQMLIILLVAKPYEKALTLIEVIGIPMILANGVGCALFLLIIKSVFNEEEKAGALQAQKTLRIADQTLVHLRKGMDVESAEAVCRILHKEIESSAVAMTSQVSILAHIGIGDDHHRANAPIQSELTWESIQKGELIVSHNRSIRCLNENCPLGTAVIAPLKQRGETIGTLKFYFTSEKKVTNVTLELISGLSMLLSTQLEIAEADKAYQLAKEAEIKALQAQISPHFLFNTLNTIVSLVRIEPVKARKLLISLSHFLRQNLTVTTETLTTLEQELKHVKAYLEIEEVRYVNRLVVEYNIDENVLLENIPPLTLQPIVENAVKHGIKNKSNNCLIKISIQKKDALTVVSIEDNGQGISPERIKLLGVQQAVSDNGTGIGLYNVNRRLTIMFGVKSALRFESKQNEGTKVSFILG
ncbi:sensor histidine kinase [Paenisporosarcina sp. TG-14]|uniref:sensor histidine kinase n=1 Tax=Paenisporosarcina sp. TG-14 TaxID=1231057 RepID=UPI0002D8E696|nr:sensor histidine kinase [Paenisporosarcina sp. TG-14]